MQCSTLRRTCSLVMRLNTNLPSFIGSPFSTFDQDSAVARYTTALTNHPPAQNSPVIL